MTPDTRGLSLTAEEAAVTLTRLAAESIPHGTQQSACLLGAAALRQTKTCGTCEKQVARDRNCTQLVSVGSHMWMENGRDLRPGDPLFSCGFWTPKAPPVAEGETR